MGYNWLVRKTYSALLLHRLGGTTKVTINRPDVHNAFRPQTLF